MKITVCTLAALALMVSSAFAAGDFPLASCEGWNGTVIERDGIDTVRATMSGIVTKADLQEYRERDPDGETREFGGKLTKAQCVENYLRKGGRATMTAEANCKAGTVSYRYADRQGSKAGFPIGPDADTSCVSGMPPLVEQFKMLCPTAAKRLRVE